MSKGNKGGRPPFEVTEEMREQVARCAGGGMTHEEMAAALGICRNTFEKHFAAELNEVALQRRQQVMNAMFEAALKGNVSAMKAYLDRVDPSRAGLGIAPAEDRVRPQPKGKKQLQQEEALRAHENTEWANLLKPGLPQ